MSMMLSGLPLETLYTYTNISILILIIACSSPQCLRDHQLVLFLLVSFAFQVRILGCNDIDGDNINEEEELDVEKECDVRKLREEIRKERKRRAVAEAELEKERNAALWAADEAMAKIAMLRNEKGMVEREAHQHREMAEQRRLYDREVIDDLKWIISNLRNGNGNGNGNGSESSSVLESS